MLLSLICALAENRAIGFGNRLLYHLPADLRRFKALTTGHTIIMGRKTFESLPKGALPNRRNIVLSTRPSYQPDGTEVFASLEAALAACAPDEEVYIIGGERVYAAALPLASRLLLTHIHATPSQADAFFPAYDPAAWRRTFAEAHPADERNPVPYTFADYERC